MSDDEIPPKPPPNVDDFVEAFLGVTKGFVFERNGISFTCPYCGGTTTTVNPENVVPFPRSKGTR